MKKYKIIKGVVIFMFICIYILYTIVGNIEEQHNKKIEIYQQEKADYVFELIDLFYQQASQSASLKAKRIREQLLNSYDNIYDLKLDIDKMIEGDLSDNRLMNITRKEFEGYTLNNVNPDTADNNDLIQMIRGYLTVDLSVNCSTDEGRLRSVEDEISQQFSKELARKAFVDILALNKNYTLWHFLPVKEDDKYYEEIKNYDSTSLKQLKQDFIKHNTDLEFLSGFEFLAVARIDNDKDLFGNYLVSTSGHRQDNYIIYIIQGFNLIDQIETARLTANIEDYDKRIETEKDNFKLLKSWIDAYILIIFMVGVLLIFYLEEVAYEGNNNADTKRG